MANLEEDCGSLLNAEYYSSKVQYLMGEGAIASNVEPIKVAELWQFDD